MKKSSIKFQYFFLASLLVVLTGCVYASKTPSSTHTSPALSGSEQVHSNKVTTSAVDFPDIHPNSAFAKSSVIVANILTRFEYDKKPLDREMSKKIFENYFSNIDSQKMFFTAADVEGFKSVQPFLSDMLLEGDLRFAFDVFLVYRQRADQRYRYAISLLDKPFDFTVDESFYIDRKEAKWGKTDEEINDIWRRRVKNDYLRLKLAKMKDSDIRKRLRKRYTNNRNQVVRLNSEDVAELFLNAYADSTDPHTNFYSPTSAKNFDVQLSLSVEGIGAVLQKRDEYGQIREVVAGGPASESGQIHPGDRIVGVAQGDNGAMEEVIDWSLDDIVKKIRGKRGSVVRIELIPAEGGLDGEHRTVRIVRDKVTLENQAARSKIVDVPQKGEAMRKVGVITVPSFYEDFEAHRQGDKDYKSVSSDVEKILLDYKKEGVAAVVLDLRANGGGSLSEAAKLSGLFIGNNQAIVQVRSAQGDVSTVHSAGVEKIWDKPIVVIVDRISASASEIFAAAIQDYGRGVVVGDSTWGKGTVQTFRSLSDFLRYRPEKEELGALKWTIQKFFRVNGSSTQVKGVSPDIYFPATFDHEELGESSYENAMPWTEIPKARYQPVENLDALIKALNEKHLERTKQSGSWQLVVDEANYALMLSQRKSYSLKQSVREQERASMDKTYKGFKQRRRELGEVDLATFKLDDGLAAGEGDLKKELEDEKKRKENLDTIALESTKIAADIVDLLKK